MQLKMSFFKLLLLIVIFFKAMDLNSFNDSLIDVFKIRIRIQFGRSCSIIIIIIKYLTM